jgi:hypothetical protein
MVIMFSPSNCFEIQGFPNPLFFHKHFKQIGSYQQCVNNPVNSVFLCFIYFFFVFLFLYPDSDATLRGSNQTTATGLIRWIPEIQGPPLSVAPMTDGGAWED